MRNTCTILYIFGVLVLSACGTFHQGSPPEMVGLWDCDEKASDGTDVGYYELRVSENGEFSLYDTVGNPGISGEMGNDSGESIDVVLNTDDMDVPTCWSMKEKDTIRYVVKGDKLTLEHNGVIMSFMKE